MQEHCKSVTVCNIVLYKCCMDTMGYVWCNVKYFAWVIYFTGKTKGSAMKECHETRTMNSCKIYLLFAWKICNANGAWHRYSPMNHIPLPSDRVRFSMLSPQFARINRSTWSVYWSSWNVQHLSARRHSAPLIVLVLECAEANIFAHLVCMCLYS